MVRAADGSRQRIGRRRRCGDQPSGRAGETEGGRALRPVQRPLCAVAVGRVRGGTAPRQPLPGTREAWPQRVSWLTHLKGARQPSGKRAGRPAAAGISGRRSLHTVHGEVRPKQYQQPESKPFPKASSVVPDADRPPPAAPPLPPGRPWPRLAGGCWSSRSSSHAAGISPSISVDSATRSRGLAGVALMTSSSGVSDERQGPRR